MANKTKKKQMDFGTCIHGKKQYVRHEVDWPNRFRVRALPFQKDDYVMTPQGAGIISAVGMTGLRGIVYRVKHNYWYGFQIKKKIKK